MKRVLQCMSLQLNIEGQMSLQGNSPRPRISITSSRNQDDIGDLELPERSRLKIIVNPLPGESSQKDSQNQDIDEQIFNLELLPDSHIMSKQNATATTSQTFFSQKNDSKNQQKNAFTPTIEVNIKTTRNSPSKKKAADISGNAVQKSKWASMKPKSAQQQQAFNDNNEPSQCLQNQQQINIRKRIQEKVKNGYNVDKQGAGLKAKAEQLRRENQLKQRAILQERQSNKKQAMNSQRNAGLNQNKQQNRENANLKIEHGKGQTNVNDTWDNASKRQGNKIQMFEVNTTKFTVQSIAYYYEKEFHFNQSTISNDSIGRSQKYIQQEQQQSQGFSFCSCFGPSKRPKITNYNTAIAKRLVAISKHPLTNSPYEQFILKQIWSFFANKPFSRFGLHWIQLGFQGKDPFTDLRSTGILSLLQWLQFIIAHPKLTERYYVWSVSHYFPMALTFIQITDIFLDLLSKGTIKSESWQGFQRCYNCIVLGMFQKLMQRYKLGELIPNFVQIQASQVKKQFKALMASYDQQFKRMK